MNKWKLVKKGKIKRFRFGWVEILKKRKNEKKTNANFENIFVSI